MLSKFTEHILAHNQSPEELDEMHDYPSWYDSENPILLDIQHVPCGYIELDNPATIYKRYYVGTIAVRHYPACGTATTKVVETMCCLSTAGWTPLNDIRVFAKPVRCRYSGGMYFTARTKLFFYILSCLCSETPIIPIVDLPVCRLSFTRSPTRTVRRRTH